LQHSFEEQIIALAAVFQSAALVRQIAQEGVCSPSAFETSINSLFITSPDTTIEVFGGVAALAPGLKALYEAMEKQASQKNTEVIRYAVSLVHLESKLKKRGDMLEIIEKRIIQATDQRVHLGDFHTNVMHNLASLYSDTISTFALRIQVLGQPEHLTVNANADKIRALLLAGIRAAMLWRQVGGRRWHLVFKRGKIAQQAKALINQFS
jgi:high frequency lysogenization protein